MKRLGSFIYSSVQSSKRGNGVKTTAAERTRVHAAGEQKLGAVVRKFKKKKKIPRVRKGHGVRSLVELVRQLTAGSSELTARKTPTADMREGGERNPNGLWFDIK